MIDELVLGIDLSTHGVKVLAVDSGGRLHANAQAGYERYIAAGGVQEQPLEPVWEAVCRAISQLVSALPDPTRIAGLSITHQRGTLVVLDIHEQLLGPTICDSDTRSWAQAHWLQREVGGKRLYQLSGCPPLPFNGLTKILWWRQTHPEMTHQVGYWLSMQDWLAWRMTGKLTSSPGSALRLGVLNIQQPQQYSSEVLALAHIPVDTLLPLVPFGKSLGRIQSQPSKETGLPVGLPVFPSPGDQAAALMGSGALASCRALVNLGTSFLTSFSVDGFIEIPANIPATLEVLPDGIYALELGEGAGTNVLDWLRLNLLDLPSITALNDLAAASPAGANGLRVIPHWWAILDDQRQGVIEGLHSYHTRADLVRATFEGLVFELRRAWEKLEHCTMDSPRQLAVCGGASSNRLLCQMIADVLDRPLVLPVCRECSALGAAMSAACALGWYENITTAVERMSHSMETIRPQPADRDFYQQAYLNYFSDHS